MLKIVIPGEPEAWARAGVVYAYDAKKGKMKPRFFDRYKGKVEYKAQLRQFFMHALTSYGENDTEKGKEHFLAGGYDVSIRLYFSPPKNISKGDANLLSWGLLDKQNKPDCDNCAKLVGDAGNELLWEDDAQIVSMYIKKYFCKDGKPRTEIEVSPRKKPENAAKVLSEVSLDEVEKFCSQAEFLGGILARYKGEISGHIEPDELYASSIAYHLTRIVDDHCAMLKKLDKHKKLWQNINAEANLGEL